MLAAGTSYDRETALNYFPSVVVAAAESVEETPVSYEAHSADRNMSPSPCVFPKCRHAIGIRDICMGLCAKYEPFHSILAADWVKEMAGGEGNVEPLAENQCAELSSLNSEQFQVLSQLRVQYAAVKVAVLSGKRGCELPPPLGLVVYGLGGTGKSHVPKAFKKHVIDCDPEPNF
jgi:hypothetical protein